MSDTLRQNLQSIRKLSTELNALSDELNESVQYVERFLIACSFGIEAFVRAPDAAQIIEGDEPQAYLHFCRVNGKFRIAVSLESSSHGFLSLKARAECSRETKLQTFKVLPELLEKIVTELRSTIDSARQTAASIKPIISTLQQLNDPTKENEATESKQGEDDGIPF